MQEEFKQPFFLEDIPGLDLESIDIELDINLADLNAELPQLDDIKLDLDFDLDLKELDAELKGLDEELKELDNIIPDVAGLELDT